MSARADFVRDRMQQHWNARHRTYATRAAPQTAVFARSLVDRVGLSVGQRVLDVATGSGVVAIEAAQRVGPAGEVIATDLVNAWAAVIAEECARAGVSNIQFRVMGAETLDLPDASFDAALCQFGLMFVPEPDRALREMRRVLRPSGRLGVTVWSTVDRVACFAPDRLLGTVLPSAPDGEQLPGPLELGEPSLIERLVTDAGFRDVETARHSHGFLLSEPEEEWRFRTEQGLTALVEAVNALTPGQRRQLHDDFITLLEGYRRGNEIRLPSEAIFVTARR